MILAVEEAPGKFPAKGAAVVVCLVCEGTAEAYLALADLVPRVPRVVLRPRFGLLASTKASNG